MHSALHRCVDLKPVFADDVRLRRGFSLLARYIHLSAERDRFFQQDLKAAQHDYIWAVCPYGGRYGHAIPGPITTLAALDRQLCAAILKNVSFFGLAVNRPGRMQVVFVNDNTRGG